jgi:uncharacterized protein YbjT (DUF2867 family)
MAVTSRSGSWRVRGVLLAALLVAGSLAGARAQHELTGELPQPAGDAGPALVVVFGGTGRTGRLVLAELARTPAFAVRAVARDPAAAQADPALAGLAQWVPGDVTAAATLAPVLRGARYVICTVGATDRSGPNGPEFVDYGGVRSLAAAARDAGVRQFVLVSSMGVESGGGVVGWFLNLLSGDALEWKQRGEQALRASGVPYTIVRPGGLTDKPGGSAGVRFQQGDQGMGSIPRADVAAVVVAALGEADAIGRTFEIRTDDGLAPGAWRRDFAGLARDRAGR